MPDPQSIGRYRVDRRIGAGAFAIVWLAHDDLLQSPVAVKVLADNWAERLDIRARFLEEARILRRADSDHVVRVHDIGELDDNRPYFVMTYADGGTLADRLAAGPLPVDVAVRHARGVSDGLSVLHELGVVHRDVKPSNVLFDTSRDPERVLIADLGLARAVAHASGFTMAAGTPGYMSPEQAVMGGSVDARADVYALGALILNMVTGTVPRTVSDTRSARLALADADVLPGELGGVVRRALSPDPADRYASAAEMAVALRGVRLTPVPAPTRPASARTQLLPLADPPSQQDSPAPPPVVEPHPSLPPQPAVAQPAVAQPAVAQPVAQEPLPPTQAPPPSAGGRIFRSRARRRVWLVVAAVLLCAVAGGAYAVLRTVVGDPLQTVSANGISVDVPRSWAKHYQDGSWNGQGKGLDVASDLDAWRNGSTPGVFVGSSKKLADVPDKTIMRQHTNCGSPEKVTTIGQSKVPSGWSVVRWAGCGNVTYYEAIHRGDGNVVYAQIKEQVNGDERAVDILASIKVATP